jgi:hypothetical protein
MKSFIALPPRIFFKYPFVTQREMTRGQMFLECLSLSLSLSLSSSPPPPLYLSLSHFIVFEFALSAYHLLLR